MEVIQGRGYTYFLQYDIAWRTKGRFSLSDNIRKRLEDIIYELVKERGCQIINLEVSEYYVRILIDCKPQHTVSDIIKVLKGTSALRIYKEYPDLKNTLPKGMLWESDYFAAVPSEEENEYMIKYLNK